MNHHLFTINNPKTMKGEAQGWLTAILHLAPHESSGVVNVCPKATPECIALCLNTAGMGGIGLTTAGDNAVQRARRARTVLYHEGRGIFIARLQEEVEHWYTYARKRGLSLAVRINGTSDLPALSRAVARVFKGRRSMRFYDYTKILTAAFTADHPIHYTFSRSENNLAECRAALSQGTNVAVVFNTPKSGALPAQYLGRPVIDGDAHDLRFLDPQGVIVGLRAKGRARKATAGGFVVSA